MPTLASFLLSMAGPLALRVLTALGISVITFTGVTEAMTAAITYAQNAWGGVTPAVMSLASLAGFPEAIGLIMGAYTSRVGLWVASNATKWIVK